MINPSSPYGRIEDSLDETSERTPHPGTVAGAVLRSARLSASLSEARLAKAAGVSEATIHAWEHGSLPLASVPAPGIERLEAALNTAGAERLLVADLAAAAWCDLVILTITDSEDASCLLADPIAGEDAFHELLAWAIADQPPARHRPYAVPGRLLPTADLALTAAVVHALDAVRHQPETATGVEL